MHISVGESFHGLLNPLSPPTRASALNVNLIGDWALILPSNMHAFFLCKAIELLSIYQEVVTPMPTFPFLTPASHSTTD